MRMPGIPPCAVGFHCDNTIESDSFGFLIVTTRCLPNTKAGAAQARKKPDDPQVGSSVRKQAVNSISTSTMYYELKISDDMLASVSAHFLSEFLLYISIVIGANGNAT
jgi:hypothetical protein